MYATPLTEQVFVLLVLSAFWCAVGLVIGLSLARWLQIRAEQRRQELQRQAWRSGAVGMHAVVMQKGGRAWQG